MKISSSLEYFDYMNSLPERCLITIFLWRVLLIYLITFFQDVCYYLALDTLIHITVKTLTIVQIEPDCHLDVHSAGQFPGLKVFITNIVNKLGR